MIVKDGAREAPKPRGMVGDPLAWGLIIRETIALLLVFVFQKRDENSAAALPPPQAASHSCAVGQVEFDPDYDLQGRTSANTIFKL
jgi:hypothetical protein